MSIIEFCLPFSVAMLGLSYPVILQVISKLDDKYGSDFVSIFKKEDEFQWFTLLLKTNLTFNLIYIIIRILTTYIHSAYDEFIFLEAKLLILISLIGFITSFFYLIKKMFRYYSVKELADYIIQIGYKKSQKNELLYLNALKGLAIHSIKQHDPNLSTTLAFHCYDLFNNYRNLYPNNAYGYPEHYYDHIYTLANELSLHRKNQTSILEHYIFSGLLITGELKFNSISERSYVYLWWITKLSIINKNDDLVLEFWANSFNYYHSIIRDIEPIYSNNYHEVLNKEQVEVREKEKHRFLEFHYALGGLILYRKRYHCLARIFAYTMSQPPDYALFPSSNTEIYQWFLEFQEDFRSPISFINMRYSFPELDGLDADYTIRYWISKYLVLHFLKLYTRHEYYITQKFNEMPSLPESLSKQKYWLEHINVFKKILKEVMEDNNLKKIYSLEFLNDEWCIENGKVSPENLIDGFHKKLIESINFKEITQEIELDKLNQFNKYNNNAIINTIEEYKNVLNKNVIDKDYKHWSNGGFTGIFDKAGFCSNQGVDYVNTISFLAEQYLKEFKTEYSNILFQQKTKTYSLRENEILNGLEQMKLDKHKHLIISFGLSYFFNRLADQGLIKKLGENFYSHNNIHIFNFQIYNFKLTDRSLFVIEQRNLPSIQFNEFKKEIIEKYNLELVNGSINLFGNIIDLYKYPEIKNEILHENQDKDLDKSVLAYLGIYTEFRIKENIKLVQLRVFSEYKERGLPDQVNSISEF